jgi:hypothetical protein
MLAWQGIVYNLFLEKISHKRLYNRLYLLSGALNAIWSNRIGGKYVKEIS